MDVTVYNTTSEPNAIYKNLGTGVQYTGTVRDPGEIAVTDPVVLIAAGVDPSVNYCYISTFGRYYHCMVRSVRDGLTELICHVDVLMSYQSDIISLPAIADRAQTVNNQYSSYLVDTKQKMYTYKTICTKRLHTFSYGSNYILLTAG